MTQNTQIAEVNNVKINNIYDELMRDRKNIDIMLSQHDQLDQKYEDNMLKVEQSNSEFIVWFVFAILIITYLVKMMIFPDSSMSIFRMFFWMILFMLFVICSFQLNKAPGFLLWGVIIVFFAIVNMKIIPSP